jgi:hypothetical protein
MLLFENQIQLLNKLKPFFQQRDDILMAFLFGSQAKDMAGIESDVDIAVYFQSETGELDFQNETASFKNEGNIWLEIERLIGRNVDLVVLNRSPAVVADEALRGIPIIIKNRSRFLDFLLKTTSEAIDFRNWTEDYWTEKEKRRHAGAGR